MCFRPSMVEVSINCPKCGKKINAVMGTIPNTCPFCEEDLEKLTADINAGAGITAPVISPPVSSRPASIPVSSAQKKPPVEPGIPKAPGIPRPFK